MNQPVIRITVGGRTYELVAFLKEGESSVLGNELVKRARELDANLGEEEARFILEHQSEIPTEIRGVEMVFPGWTPPKGWDYPPAGAYLYWYIEGDLRVCVDVDSSWRQYGRFLDQEWGAKCRLVRRCA